MPRRADIQHLEVSLADKDIQSLVRDIDAGKIVLPEFQRDFVWPTVQVSKLLESLLNGYYINTLLTLPVVAGEESVPFPPRPVAITDGEPDLSRQMDMVLDGQQRITSIYYALKAPDIPLKNTSYPQRFGLKFSKVVDGVLNESAVDWKSTYYDKWRNLAVDDYETHIDDDFVPFTVFEDEEIFNEWRYALEDLSAERSDITLDEVRQFDRNTKVFRGYDVPIIRLDAETRPSTVVQTFERINTQGLELGVFDILTARLYPDDINLRELWETATDEYSNIDSYRETASEDQARKRVLKTLALHRDTEVDDDNLRELSSEDFEEDWNTACQMMNRALDRAYSTGVGGLGVTDKFGFPYPTMLPPLANLLHLAEENPSVPDRRGLEMMKRWYWASIFAYRYSVSSDTAAYQDFRQVSSWIRDEREELPEAIEDAPNRIPVELDLESLTPGSGAYKAIMSLLILNGAKDFGTFESITIHQVDDHHIFPKSMLSAELEALHESSTVAQNRILNRTIIEARANRFQYRDRRPSDYIRDMISDHPDGEEGVASLLEDHFINEDGFNALLDDDYPAFCNARKSELQQEIVARVGEDIHWSRAESMI